MTVAIKTQLGPYLVLAPLGAGGMGEVYRAKDSRLDREVAIKVLPEALARDKERILRFEREAKVLASLNHPNIAAIYGFEEFEGKRFLVMELAEGETLAERLNRGPIPIRDALEFANGIAIALEAAHEKGIIHRDLKPANVKVTPDGMVKVLDFGLAKAMTCDTTGTDIANSPTITMEQTRPGIVLGTAAYMSPEQARGKPLDKRTDIWSFGVLLYECLTGRRPFEGQTTSDLVAKILEREPDWSALPAGTPPLVQLLLRRCLAKDRNKRLHDIGDARLEIELATHDQTTIGLLLASASSTVGRARLTTREGSAWALTLLLAITVGTAWLLRAQSVPPGPGAFRELNLRPEAIFRAGFAPDGKTVVYSAASEGNTPEIFTIRPDYPEPQSLGLRSTHLLAVSSKGELAVLVGAKFIEQRLFEGTLARVPLGGGAPREILQGVREADWSPDGERLAIIREVDGKDRLEYPIGRVLCESAGYLSDLRVSPKGDRVAYFEHPWRWDDRGSVNIVDLKGRTTVCADGHWGEEGIAWSPDGREVLFSASFAGMSLSVYAAAEAGQNRLAFQGPGGLTIHDISRGGRWLATRDSIRYGIMVRIPGTEKDRELTWLGFAFGGVLSQDGRILAFSEAAAAMGTNYAACLRNTDGSPVVRLGEGNTEDLSRDGKWVLAIVPSSPPKLMVYPTGPGDPVQLERGDFDRYADGRFFRDGTRVLINAAKPGKGLRFYLQEVNGGASHPVTPEGTRDGRLSPDERQILARGPDGSFLVYPIDGGEAQPVKWLAREDKVIHWSADGKSVLVARGREVPCRVERVDLDTGRRELFREIVPGNLTGLTAIYPTFVTDDEQSYVYKFVRQTSVLFMSEAPE